jgi:hypothetical protein
VDTAWPSLDAAAEVDTARVVYIAPEKALPTDRALPGGEKGGNQAREERAGRWGRGQVSQGTKTACVLGGCVRAAQHAATAEQAQSYAAAWEHSKKGRPRASKGTDQDTPTGTHKTQKTEIHTCGSGGGCGTLGVSVDATNALCQCKACSLASGGCGI